MPKLPIRSLTPSCKKARSQSGQILIEYILLMVVTLGLALLIIKMVVQRDPDNPGFLIQRWQGMVKQIGLDDPNRRGP